MRGTEGESGSILGLTSALFFNILVYICWHKRLSTAGTCLALESWVHKAQPLPTGAHPSPSGDNTNNWTHMQHWAEYKFNFPTALPIQSSPLLSFLFITPYFSFLTSYFSFWLELSWKWNFSGGQLDSKSPLLMCHSIHHLLFSFLWVTTCELHMGSMWKSSPIKCRPFPVHFPSPLFHWSLFIATPHRPPSPGLTKADSSKLSFWDCLFHFELDTKLLFLTVELFSMLDTNILISCYLSWGRDKVLHQTPTVARE